MEIDNLETPGPNDVQKKRSRKDSEGIEIATFLQEASSGSTIRRL
ncbi:11112_t:CDS:2 [Rhizophagus irregularis]|nr:11112_t:CDS:2 [Rhizophagus irregularis]